MRKVKARGHSGLHQRLDDWTEAQCSSFSADSEILENQQRCWAKLRHVWGIDVGSCNSGRGHPKGLTKKLMLRSLYQVYQAWKDELDATGEPYYLKVWLYEPWIEDSQVVCAVGDLLGSYEEMFESLGEQCSPEALQSVPEMGLVDNWVTNRHAAYYSESEWQDDEKMMKWLNGGGFETREMQFGDGTSDTTYIVPIGRVFVGG